jgi:hypothetical protein
MISAERPRLAEIIDVPPNGLRRYPERVGQHIDGRKPLGLNHLYDFLPSISQIRSPRRRPLSSGQTGGFEPVDPELRNAWNFENEK